MIELIAVDLDGTLLNSDHVATPRTIAALRRAMTGGIHVVMATGKTRISAEPTIDALGLTSPGVFLQGLAIYNGDGTIRAETTLANEIVDHMCTISQSESHTLVAYCGNRLLTGARDRYTDRLIPYHEPMPEAVGSLRSVFDTVPIHKLLFIDEPARLDVLRRRLALELDGIAGLVQALPDMLEILPLGASKGAGLKWLLDDLGIEPANVMAIGDAENDIEMLKLVGIGVAMGNATAEVKRIADFVTADNDSDGIADAVEKFVFVEN